MHSLVSLAFKGPVARIPTPPALETAATSSGVLIQDIPGRMTGCLQLKSFVIRVLMLMILQCCVMQGCSYGRIKWGLCCRSAE
jgi:hypothetical protein